MISVKTSSDIEKMAEAGKINAEVLRLMRQIAKPGMSTAEMNDEAEKLITSYGAKPSFKNYNGFKFATCMSVDDVVVHGFPSKRPLKEGEILSVDVGVYLNGFHADAARTFAIGEIEMPKQRLIDVTRESFFEGIKFAKAGLMLNEVSGAIQYHAEKNGYSVVRVMTGHGIGHRLHEDPSVYNYVDKRVPNIRLRNGYALAIEPMINMGHYDVYTESDGWTCRTRDAKVSAHYENTLIVTDGEPLILTLGDEDV